MVNPQVESNQYFIDARKGEKMMYKRIARFKKVFVVLIALSLLAAITAVVYANGNNTEQVNWTIAGPIFGKIVNNSSDGDYSLLVLTAKGSPGTAEITAVGTAQLVDGDEQCPGAAKQLKFVNGSFVAVFPDQSMLYFQVDESGETPNALCFGAEYNEGKFTYNIVGGEGRYEGASGSILVSTKSWAINSAMSVETGEITGVIELP